MTTKDYLVAAHFCCEEYEMRLRFFDSHHGRSRLCSSAAQEVRIGYGSGASHLLNTYESSANNLSLVYLAVAPTVR